MDKTDLVYRLVTEGEYYFLSRPRRFGKSLLVSTLEAYFQGEKELFEGLAIAELEKKWIEYPVLHIDFAKRTYTEDDSLPLLLNDLLEGWEARYGVKAKRRKRKDYEGRFSKVIAAAHAQTGQLAVVLIDEYDKPILDADAKIKLHKKNRELLRSFYNALKSSGAHLRFVFLTGITKFAHVSIFSGLNNLEDISLTAQYAPLCGITERELHAHLAEGVEALAAWQLLTLEEAYRQIKAMYDGTAFP